MLHYVVQDARLYSGWHSLNSHYFDNMVQYLGLTRRNASIHLGVRAMLDVQVYIEVFLNTIFPAAIWCQKCITKYVQQAPVVCFGLNTRFGLATYSDSHAFMYSDQRSKQMAMSLIPTHSCV
jgi:hypothetical protein